MQWFDVVHYIFPYFQCLKFPQTFFSLSISSNTLNCLGHITYPQTIRPEYMNQVVTHQLCSYFWKEHQPVLSVTSTASGCLGSLIVCQSGYSSVYFLNSCLLGVLYIGHSFRCWAYSGKQNRRRSLLSWSLHCRRGNILGRINENEQTKTKHSNARENVRQGVTNTVVRKWPL